MNLTFIRIIMNNFEQLWTIESLCDWKTISYGWRYACIIGRKRYKFLLSCCSPWIISILNEKEFNHSHCHFRKHFNINYAYNILKYVFKNFTWPWQTESCKSSFYVLWNFICRTIFNYLSNFLINFSFWRFLTDF